MGGSLKCSNCGAPYRGTVPSWVDFVKCEYCGCSTRVERVAAITVGGQNTPTSLSAKRAFNLGGFYTYLTTHKGIKNFDPVSGTLMINGKSVTVDQSGLVSGENPARGVVERWIAEYISTGIVDRFASAVLLRASVYRYQDIRNASRYDADC